MGAQVMMVGAGREVYGCERTEIGYGGGSLMALNRIDISDLDPRLQGCATVSPVT